MTTMIDSIAKYNEMMNRDIDNTMEFLSVNPILLDFVKNFNEPHGFVWSENPLIIDIMNTMNEDDHHSPSSMALCLRECQRRLKSM